MAANFNFKHKKKLPVDGHTGMHDDTRRHFERVKQKMFAFVGQQHQMEAEGNHIAAPPPFRPSALPPRVFADRKGLKPSQQHHHHRASPMPPRKHLPTHFTPHKRLPHLALATPQVARR